MSSPASAPGLRVLQLLTCLGAGGAERVAVNLAAGLAAAGAPTMVAALDGRGPVAAELSALGVPVCDLRLRRKWGFGGRGPVAACLRLRRLLREWRPAVLHTHLFHANLLGRLAARGLNVPVVSTCHIREARPRPWHFWLDRWTAPLARAEVCVSAATAAFQQARTGLPQSFFPVVENGVSLGDFRPVAGEGERAALRARLAASLTAASGETGAANAAVAARLTAPGATVCGFLGRLDWQKGADVLLSAWKALAPETRAGAVLLIGGAGPEEKRLREMARGEEGIAFCGFQERPRDFLAAIDVCAMPSRYEGFGLVAVEALACGAALAVSPAVTGIVDNGENGVQVPGGDPALWADALTQLIANPQWRAALAAAGRARAASFASEKMVAGYLAVYRAALAGG